MKRKRWARGRRPKDPQAAARQVWRYVYPGQPWPRGRKGPLRIEWVGWMNGAMGLAIPSHSQPRILLSWGDFNGKRGRERSVIETLLHEFIHIRHPQLRHGQEFLRLHNAALVRCGLPPRAHWRKDAA